MTFKEFKNGKIRLYNTSKFIGEVHIVDVDKPGAYVLLLHIKDKYQNKGYGQTLLNYVLDRAINSKCVSISLFCATNNEGAIRFYERNGFFKGYFRSKPSPHYLMVKKLD